MAAAANLIPSGLLHMRPFQFWLRGVGFQPRRHPLDAIRDMRHGLRTLLMWTIPRFMALGPTLEVCHHRRTLLQTPYFRGCILDGHPAQGLWVDPQLSWHINCLEMRAVFLALKHFLPHLRGFHVLVCTDSTTVVAYINHLAQQILLWAESILLSLRAIFVPGHINWEADFLSRQVLRPGEWWLHPQVEILRSSEVDLFISEESTQCPLWYSLSHPAPLGLDGLANHALVLRLPQKFLTLKTALLLALASLRQLGDLQALLVTPTCLEFSPGMSKAILHPRAGYVPKVPRMAGHLVILQAFCLPPYELAELERLHLLCPVRALRTYVHRSGSWRKSPSLFVCFGSRNKGNPVSKQHLAPWVIEAITQAYEACDIASPLGVRAHSTRGVTSSSALARGVSLQEICAVARWSSLHTFIRFYNLDLDPTPGSQVLQG
ncbi:hypothetical protein QTP70_030696 [Hemibagrus guttatus]|uniref:Tyr recombinase domain-containing protein n=1 Tax=Hemibagrus guttatus TaxID=175788 RepID=A0AAE0UZU8_9TELE|nr:hypothetical protein QTP70_030696 [Hemibagrus guttatus]